MFSTQAWAAHYGLPLNTPEDFVQGYVDAMRLDAKGQGKPCGRGFIAPGKKCSAKGSRQLAQDLRAGDAKAKARVATGKRNAMAQQAARRQLADEWANEVNEREKTRKLANEWGREAKAEMKKQPEQQSKRTRSPEAIEKQKATRAANKAAKEARRAPLQGTLDKPGRIKRTRTTTRRRKEQIGRATGSNTARIRRGVSGARVANQEQPKPAEQPKPKQRKPRPDPYGRTPKQQYKQATSKVRELKMMGVEGAPLRQAQAEVTKLEKKFNPMVPRKKRSAESIAKGKETRAKNRAAAKKARKRYGQGFDLEG